MIQFFKQLSWLFIDGDEHMNEHSRVVAGDSQGLHLLLIEDAGGISAINLGGANYLTRVSAGFPRQVQEPPKWLLDPHWSREGVVVAWDGQAFGSVRQRWVLAMHSAHSDQLLHYREDIDPFGAGFVSRHDEWNRIYHRNRMLNERTAALGLVQCFVELDGYVPHFQSRPAPP